MIKHIVMWKLKETALGKTKDDNAKEMKILLENLKLEVEEILVIEVGINICNSEQSFDVVLYSEFNDEEALERYQKHPKHKEVAEFVKKVTFERAVVDYNDS